MVTLKSQRIRLEGNRVRQYHPVSREIDMTTAMNANPDPDIVKYCDLMEEIKLRISVVDYFISGQGHALYQPPTLESVCLQIRKILELIAFGSLVAHKDIYTSVYTKVSKAWNAGDILDELEKVNPAFYPVPVIEVPSEIPGVINKHKKRDADYLTKSDFKEVYGRCGVMAHAANPYGKGIDYDYYRKMLPLWRTGVINLLCIHEIYLLNRPGLYVIHMREDRDNKVHFYKFQPQPQQSR